MAAAGIGRGAVTRGLAAALLVLVSVVAWAAPPVLGEAVEDFRIRTLAGVELTPAGERGRILVVNLWATWCHPCREELPALEAFYRKHHRSGVDVVAVSLDDRGDLESVKAAVAAFTFPVALAVDSDLRAFGRIRHVPATFIIDRGGLLARDGWRDAGTVTAAELESVVRPLLEAAPRLADQNR